MRFPKEPFYFSLALGLAGFAAGCTELTPAERAQLDLPLHMQLLASSGTVAAETAGTDPIILTTIFDLLEVSEKIRPDISTIAGTPFEDVLGVGSPAGYALRNRTLHPGVPLAEALAGTADPATRERLVEMARWERSEEVRSTALVALARIGDERDEIIFREASAHLDAGVRFGAMEALLVWGHPNKARPLLKAAAENDPQTLLRVYAAAGMARFEDPDGLAKLRGFLDDSDWLVSAMAARYLGDFGEAADYDLMVGRIGGVQGNDFVLAEHCIAALKLFSKKT